MSKKEKLIQRFNSNPKDFTFEELKTLLGYYGYRFDNCGKTSGSRIRFINNDDVIMMHKIHSYKCLLPIHIINIRKHLEEKNK